jgi:hypothetical protein
MIGWAPKLSNQNEGMPNIFGKCALASNQSSAKILVITFSTQTSATFAKILVENFDMPMFWHAPILVGHIWLSTNQGPQPGLHPSSFAPCGLAALYFKILDCERTSILMVSAPQ